MLVKGHKKMQVNKYLFFFQYGFDTAFNLKIFHILLSKYSFFLFGCFLKDVSIKQV